MEQMTRVYWLGLNYNFSNSPKWAMMEIETEGDPFSEEDKFKLALILMDIEVMQGYLYEERMDNVYKIILDNEDRYEEGNTNIVFNNQDEFKKYHKDFISKGKSKFDYESKKYIPWINKMDFEGFDRITANLLKYYYSSCTERTGVSIITPNV